MDELMDDTMALYDKDDTSGSTIDIDPGGFNNIIIRHLMILMIKLSLMLLMMNTHMPIYALIWII